VAAAASPLIVTATRPPLSPAVLPTATPGVLVVARTDGAGLSIRSTPGTSGERIKVWPEGTKMVPLGEERQADGLTWRRVRDPDGNEGWVAAEFLVDEATFATLPTPVPRPTAPPKPAAPTAAPTRAGPTATFPPLRPTFTPMPADSPAPAKPAAPPAPAKPAAPPAPAKPTGSPAPGR
jgi:hypothetical protein